LIYDNELLHIGALFSGSYTRIYNGCKVTDNYRNQQSNTLRRRRGTPKGSQQQQQNASVIFCLSAHNKEYLIKLYNITNFCS